MAEAAPGVVWAHRGLGTDLWLRLDSPCAGRLVLRREGEGAAELALDQSVSEGRSDVVVDLAGALDRAGDVTGRWRLEVVAADGRRRPVAGRRRAALGLRRYFLVLGGDAYEVRFSAKEGADAGVEVEPRVPWAETTRIAVEGRELVLDAVLPDTVEAATTAVWRRDGHPDPVEVPVEVAGGFVSLRADLTPLGAADHGDEWSLSVRCGDILAPVEWHLDDVGDKEHALALPMVELAEGGRTIEPRFTRMNQLVAAVHHHDRAPTQEPRDRSRRRYGIEDAPPQRQSIVRSGDKDAAPPTLFHRGLALAAKVVFRVVEVTTRRRRGHATPAPDGPVHLLIANAFGVGGTVRTTFNTANALAGRRPVTLVSAYRLEERRYFDLDPAVRLRTLVDYLWMETRPPYDPRSWLRRVALRTPSALVHGEDPRAHRFDLWTDIQLVRWIRSVRSGTIVATRPGLNVAVARFARPGVVRVGQQHLPYEFTSDELWQHVLPYYRHLHALTAVTEADAEALRRQLAGAGTQIVRLPNPLAGIDPPTSPLSRPCILAAGRYNRTKGIDLLLDAFAQVVADHPDWELRVYGQAKPGQMAKARRQVRDLGLTDNVRLMVVTSRLELELSKASICAVSSRFEAFGMVIIEAMSCGVPVVSFDCPHGPREIITDGVDGVLVPPEDPDAFGAALRRLIDDEDERRRLGAAGLRTAADYAPERVVDDLEALLASLAGADGPAAAAHSSGGRP